MDGGLMFCSSCNIVKKFSRDSESPSIFNYCLQGEGLFCYVQATYVIQYYYEIRCEFDRLAVWYKLTCLYCWGFKIIKDALKIIFCNVEDLSIM